MKRLIIVAIALLLVLSACSSARQKLSPQGNVDYKTANVYYQQKNVEQAEKYYVKVLADNPDHAVALRRMADINLFNGEQFPARSLEFNEKAYNYYTKAIKVFEGFENLTDQEKIDLRDMKKRKESAWARIFQLANSELTNGNTQAAMTTFELANRLEPERPEPMIQLKNIYLKELKDKTKAEQLLLSLHNKEPEKLIYLQELGAFYYNEENYAEAVKFFEKAKPQIPRDIDNLMNISACYYELQDYPKAMAATKLAMDLDPANLDLITNARSIAAKMNDKDLVASYIIQLLDRRGNDDDYFDLVSLFYQKDDYANMIVWGEKWYNWDKTNKDAVDFLILAASKLGDKTLEGKYMAIRKTLN